MGRDPTLGSVQVPVFIVAERLKDALFDSVVFLVRCETMRQMFYPILFQTFRTRCFLIDRVGT
jgi:hypothetical protein